ncbi:hypothetical protein HPB47_010085 [Ixodes persulcatus]|uniref:Uncharacterized protein n=1 Tax=Ixodes persulcatus TaxID=34615 RepID=A0AC60P045_IXOPE|nr:hypothetical protein HPB47_010085 [Ixodes persulcatus]
MLLFPNFFSFFLALRRQQQNDCDATFQALSAAIASCNRPPMTKMAVAPSVASSKPGARHQVPDSPRAWYLGVLCTVYGFFGWAGIGSTPVLYVGLLERSGASREYASLPFTAMMCSYFVGSLVYGVLSRWLRERTLLVAASLVTSLSFLTSYFIGDIAVLTVVLGARPFFRCIFLFVCFTNAVACFAIFTYTLTIVDFANDNGFSHYNAAMIMTAMSLGWGGASLSMAPIVDGGVTSKETVIFSSFVIQSSGLVLMVLLKTSYPWLVASGFMVGWGQGSRGFLLFVLLTETFNKRQTPVAFALMSVSCAVPFLARAPIIVLCACAGPGHAAAKARSTVNARKKSRPAPTKHLFAGHAAPWGGRSLRLTRSVNKRHVTTEKRVSATQSGQFSIGSFRPEQKRISSPKFWFG